MKFRISGNDISKKDLKDILSKEGYKLKKMKEKDISFFEWKNDFIDRLEKQFNTTDKVLIIEDIKRLIY